MKIIDASVALKWFVHEPSGQAAADKILQEVESDPRSFAVPDLFFAEMLHILCRVFRDESKVKEALTLLETLGFERVGLGHELMQLAAETSLKHKVTGYDAVYIATAKLLDGQWFTFDRQAHQKIIDLNLSTILN